jgi:hypothetical protein
VRACAGVSNPPDIGLFRETPRVPGRAPPAVASSCLLVSRNCWCPRNTGTRPQLLRIPLSLSLPPRAPGLRSRALTRNNQASAARLISPPSRSHDDGTPAAMPTRQLPVLPDGACRGRNIAYRDNAGGLCAASVRSRRAARAPRHIYAVCGFCRAAARATNPDLNDEQLPGAAT